ncbi:hypothetical protein SISNIDRAFT_469197 [Sistotremastrum niveocremeum HHB9708]|uniref:Uncharacterized protein n=1 Tax=Sistotremastrum niveocremeum HHB9708 TaxID=1314777 RepID=A0A164QIJ6_9AGAM|nr:hypothetical protein SISNIDRAFT_469197 [Sistotremastrum niveocremeum HHB9708]
MAALSLDGASQLSLVDRAILGQVVDYHKSSKWDLECSPGQLDNSRQISWTEETVFDQPAYVLYGGEGRPWPLKFIGYIGPSSRISLYGTNIAETYIVGHPDESMLTRQRLDFVIHPFNYPNHLLSEWNGSDRRWFVTLEQHFVQFIKKQRMHPGLSRDSSQILNLKGSEKVAVKLDAFTERLGDDIRGDCLHVQAIQYTLVDEAWTHGRERHGTARSAIKRPDGTLCSASDPASKLSPLSNLQKTKYRPVVQSIFLEDNMHCADPFQYSSTLCIGTPVMVKAQPFIAIVKTAASVRYVCSLRLIAMRILDGSVAIDRRFVEHRPTPTPSPPKTKRKSVHLLTPPSDDPQSPTERKRRRSALPVRNYNLRQTFEGEGGIPKAPVFRRPDQRD